MKKHIVTKPAANARRILPALDISVFVTLLSAFLTDSVAATSPLKVFILAGQSNMEGQAVVD